MTLLSDESSNNPNCKEAADSSYIYYSYYVTKTYTKYWKNVPESEVPSELYDSSCSSLISESLTVHASIKSKIVITPRKWNSDTFICTYINKIGFNWIWKSNWRISNHNSCSFTQILYINAKMLSACNISYTRVGGHTGWVVTDVISI